jgi:hypothetical protein
MLSKKRSFTEDSVALNAVSIADAEGHYEISRMIRRMNALSSSSTTKSSSPATKSSTEYIKGVYKYSRHTECINNFDKWTMIRVFKKAIRYNQLEVVKKVVKRLPNIQADLTLVEIGQIEYDCRISNDMLYYIKSLFKIQYHIIPHNSTPSTLYVDKKYYRSLCIPGPSSIFWNTIPFIFVEIPKTATCSIANTIKRKNCFGHCAAKVFPPHVRSKIKTICRNPYSRAVSAYLFIKRGGFGRVDIYIKTGLAYPTFESWVLDGLTEDKLMVDDSCTWEPCTKQTYYVVDDFGELILDKNNIGYFENLNGECQRLFGFPLTYHHNKSEMSSDWRTYYTNKSVQEKVYKLYKSDFKLFGYSKQIDGLLTESI